MRRIACFILLAATLSILSGCYAPEGGSSIPWNQPAPSEGSLSPRVNF